MECGRKLAWLMAAVLGFTLIMTTAACGPSATRPVPTAPSYADITPGPHKIVPDLSRTIEVPPFPYSAPLPPALPTALDGLYTRTVPLQGTPVPCKRCAGYRLEGGVWTLFLDKGIYKVFQRDSDFEAVGSFALTGDRIAFFNDPYCEEDLSMMGSYTWKVDRDSLSLKVIDDPCSIGLRAGNLTFAQWERVHDPCQPPNREAAVTDHWKKPPECDRPLTPSP